MTYRDPREPYEAVPVWPVREEREAVDTVWSLLRIGSLHARGEIYELLARDERFLVMRWL